MANRIAGLKKDIIIVLTAILCLASATAANNCTALYYNGPSEYRHDIVVVGHAYTVENLSKFYTDVNESISFLLNMTPYSNYSKLINVWYVNQSADLGCVYDGSRLWTCDSANIEVLASQCPRDAQKTLVLINNESYGGFSTGDLKYATCYTGVYRNTCVAHEYGGHILGELMDEYNTSYPGYLYFSGANCALPEEANYTDITIPCAKWQNVGGAGCFPACSGYALYRSTYGSVMRTLSFTYAYYNNVSAIQIRKALDVLVGLMSGSYANATSIHEGEKVGFGVVRANDSDPSTIRWYINGTEQESAVNQTAFEHTFASAGTYTVTAVIDLSYISDNSSWNIIVNEANHAPVITYYSPQGDVSMDENSSVIFTVAATDPDDDVLTYLWKFDGQEKSTNMNWTYDADFSSAGNHTVLVTVSDGDLNASHLWSVVVSNINRPPVIASVPPLTAEENKTYSYLIQAEDPDYEPISHILDVYPAGMVLMGESISWVPTHDQIGINEVRIIVTDGMANTTQEFNITVAPMCVANWTVAYTNWSACQQNDTIYRVKYYYDSNSCNYTNPYENETEYGVCDYCTPNWVLSETYSECIAGVQTREYYDTNNCSEGTPPAPVSESCQKATVCTASCGGNYPYLAGYIWTEPITKEGNAKRLGYSTDCDDSGGLWHHGIYGPTNKDNLKFNDPYWTYWTAFCSNKPDSFRLCSGSCGNGYNYYGGSIWVEKGTANAPKNSVYAQGCTGNMEWRDNEWIALCSKDDDVAFCTHKCGGKWPVQIGAVWLPQGSQQWPKNNIYSEGCSGQPGWRSDWWVLICSKGEGDSEAKQPPLKNTTSLRAPLCVDGCGGDYPYTAGKIWSEPVTRDGWPKRLG
ncbi:MAG: M64 family metallopeptidase, partial [Candidatus Micrarchaeia archaeon]